MTANDRQTIIVGDVHGCLDELDALLRKARYARGDRLILAGDLVAKGPDSAGVVQRCRELGATGVRGNHDHRCLEVYWARNAGKKLPKKLGRAHRKVVDSLSAEEMEWLASLPLYLELPELKTLVVHAGLRPGVRLKRQNPVHLMNMRSLRGDGSVSMRVSEGVPWASRWSGPNLVVFGHDALRGLQRYPNAIGLDTGCVYGGELSALVFPGKRIISVRARRAYQAV